MGEYIGLDVSMKETAIFIRHDGKRIWRGKCPSDPKLLVAAIRKHSPAPQRVVFEMEPLSVWFFHALTSEELPAICIDARHAKAALDMAPNKIDANDADGLAHLAEVGFFREVRVKGYDSMLVRTLIGVRIKLTRMTTDLYSQIRVDEDFRLLAPPGKGGKFEDNVRRLLIGEKELACIILSLLEVWRSLRVRAADLSLQRITSARQSKACQLLMSIPGVGMVMATSFEAAIEDPANFTKSRSAGAWLGLTTRRYQSGEVDYDGHISRRGAPHVCTLIYEAATVILTRVSAAAPGCRRNRARPLPQAETQHGRSALCRSARQKACARRLRRHSQQDGADRMGGHGAWRCLRTWACAYASGSIVQELG